MKTQNKPYVYRIEVEEKYSGKKTYTPQAKVGFKWKNIVKTPINNYGLSSNVKESYYNEESAVEVVEKHTESVLRTLQNEVKKIYHILL